MNLFEKIKSSLRFRYNHWLKKKTWQKKEKAKALHRLKMAEIDVKEFSIISSNCWGGSVYEDLKLPYQSPTIGLFFYAQCYLELLQELKTNINLPLSFTATSKYQEANIYRNENYAYPIGLLGENIEIHFLHYKTIEEAEDKWARRKERVNWNNLYIACTDRDGMTPELMKTFDNLPYKNKVLFTGQSYPTIKSAQYLKAFKKDKIVGDLYNQRFFVTQNFNLKYWLSKKA